MPRESLGGGLSCGVDRGQGKQLDRGAVQQRKEDATGLDAEIGTFATALDPGDKFKGELQQRGTAASKPDGPRPEHGPGPGGHAAALCERGDQLGAGGACGGGELE